MFRIFILIILDVSMMAGVFPKIDDIVVRRRFQCIPNGFLTLYKFNNNNNNKNNNNNHIYTGTLVQQNEFAAINQGPVDLMYQSK